MPYIFLLGGILCAAITALSCYYIKKNSHIICLALIAILALLTLSTLFIHTSSTEPKELASIIIGTNPDFPPFEYMDNGKMIGFEIDLLQELGTRLHKKIEVVTMPFETLLPALQLGKIHIIAAGLSATPERAQHVFFSAPYLENNPLVIVSLKNFPLNNVTDLNQKQIIVNTGYSADLYMTKIHGPLITRLKSPAEAFLALQSGRAQAFITAQNTLKPFFNLHGKQKFHVKPIPNTDDNTCLAIAPNHPALQQEIQTILDIMKKDGSLQKLQEKWGL